MNRQQRRAASAGAVPTGMDLHCDPFMVTLLAETVAIGIDHFARLDVSSFCEFARRDHAERLRTLRVFHGDLMKAVAAFSGAVPGASRH